MQIIKVERKTTLTKQVLGSMATFGDYNIEADGKTLTFA